MTQFKLEDLAAPEGSKPSVEVSVVCEDIGQLFTILSICRTGPANLWVCVLRSIWTSCGSSTKPRNMRKRPNVSFTIPQKLFVVKEWKGRIQVKGKWRDPWN